MPPHRNNSGGNNRVAHRHGVATVFEEQFGETRHRNATSTYCCCPSGCTQTGSEFISVDDPMDAVKVVCNNEQCLEGCLMHKPCFESWEQQVLTFLKTCGRARSWSDKQRHQNLWKRSGYDLAFKVCVCKCGKGHLRKDLDYVAPVDDAADERSRRKKGARRKHHSGDKPKVVHFSGEDMTVPPAVTTSAPTTSSSCPRPVLRVCTSLGSSVGSSGSASCSPTSSGGSASSPTSPSNLLQQGVADLMTSTSTSTSSHSGNIFQRRPDFSSFRQLPRHKVNPYKIKMDDDGPHGNDETRCVLLSQLSVNRVTAVTCVLCADSLPIFDRYPLIDGTFFVSPVSRYSEAVVQLDRQGWLYAVCMMCLEGQHEVRCRACRRPWQGSSHVLGTVYQYDILAATPCCAPRLACLHCGHPVTSLDTPLPFFSSYSHQMTCSHCKVKDFHTIKSDMFYTVKPGLTAAQVTAQVTSQVTTPVTAPVTTSRP